MITKSAKFWSDIRGGVAVFFALAAVPVALGLGVAVDYSRARSDFTALQAVADAASLAAAAVVDEGQMQSVAETHFAKTISAKPHLAGAMATVTVSGGTVTVNAQKNTPTAFFKLIGIDGIDVAVQSMAQANISQPLELVIAMDTTNSMGSSGAREQAQDELLAMLENLYDGAETNPNIYLSFVPYNDRINIGTGNAGWLTSTPADWDGCTEPRYEPLPGFPFALSDTAPSTLGFEGTPADHTPPGYVYGNALECVDPITGPTNSRTEIETAINGYETAGTGRQDMGMAWAWRLLSPNWQDEWGVSNYPANYGDRRKVVVFATDGKAGIYCDEVNSDAPNPPPEFGGDCATNELSNEVFAHIEDLCTRMKDAGIEVYVLYVNGIARGEPYMESCASPQGYFPTETLDDITDAVAQLETSLKDVRLVQ